MQVPSWAGRARDVFRALIGLYAILWLIRGVLVLIDLIFDTDLDRDDPPTWLNVIVLSLIAVWIVCGLTWLAGAAIAGYREPKE